MNLANEFLAHPYSGSKLTIQERFYKEAQYVNNMTYFQWYNRLLDVALVGFEWKNLPEEIDPRFLELTLCFDGKALFFKNDDINEFMTLQFYATGPIDIYREPIRRTAFSPSIGFKYANLGKDNSVIIWNNYTRTPEIVALRLYAQKLYEIDRAIDVNVKGQKTPKIIRSTDTERLTMENLFRKYDGNIPFIFGSKNLADLADITVLDTTTPYVADKLMLLKRQTFAEAMTYFGVENSNTEKKERLVSSEIQANKGTVDIARQARLKARKDAAEKINRMFGLNIEVDYNAKPDMTEQMIQEEQEEMFYE